MYRDNKQTNKPTTKAIKGGDSSSRENSDFSHIEPVLAKPLEVIIYNGNFDRALKAFRALVQKERILSIWKEKQSYEKPSVRRRRKRNDRKRKLMELEYPKNKFKE